MKESKSIDSVSLNHSRYPAVTGRAKAVSSSFLRRLPFYLQLTKPTIMLPVLITGATALILESSLVSQPIKFAVFLVGLYMIGGAANAFNPYFERDIDARMTAALSPALCFRDDYERARLPMLPVIKGVDATIRQIYVYTILLTAGSFVYLFAGGGPLYGLAAALLSVMLARKTIRADKRRDRKSLWGLLTYSIIYLFALFPAMIIDKFTDGFIVR